MPAKLHRLVVRSASGHGSATVRITHTGQSLNLEVVDAGPGLPTAVAAARPRSWVTDPRDPPRGRHPWSATSSAAWGTHRCGRGGRPRIAHHRYFADERSNKAGIEDEHDLRRTGGHVTERIAALIGIVDDDPIMGELLHSVSNWKAIGHAGGNRERRLWVICGTLAAEFWSATSVCQIWTGRCSDARLDLGATPVIFITAFGEVWEQASTTDAGGADDYVTKPFDVGRAAQDCRPCARNHRGKRRARPGDAQCVGCDASR